MDNSNNPKFLRSVIRKMADKAYEDRAIENNMDGIVGMGKDYESKEDWIEGHIQFFLNGLSDSVVPFPENKTPPNPRSSAMARKLYGLPLGDTIAIGDIIKATRVPGGWVYKDVTQRGAVFIPYSDEFEYLTRAEEEEGNDDKS